MWEDILGFENAEFYIKRWPELDGMRFADVLLSFPDAIPCGVKVAARNGKIVLNPDDDYVLAEGDEVLVVADDDDSYAPSTSLPEVPLSCFFGSLLLLVFVVVVDFSNAQINLLAFFCCCSSCKLLFSFEKAMGLNVLGNVHPGQLEIPASLGSSATGVLLLFFFPIYMSILLAFCCCCSSCKMLYSLGFPICKDRKCLHGAIGA